MIIMIMTMIMIMLRWQLCWRCQVQRASVRFLPHSTCYRMRQAARKEQPQSNWGDHDQSGVFFCRGLLFWSRLKSSSPYETCRIMSLLPELVALPGGDLEKSRVAKHGTHLLTLGAQLGEKSKPESMEVPFRMSSPKINESCWLGMYHVSSRSMITFWRLTTQTIAAWQDPINSSQPMDNRPSVEGPGKTLR